jgi:hypothetical protein
LTKPKLLVIWDTSTEDIIFSKRRDYNRKAMRDWELEQGLGISC